MPVPGATAIPAATYDSEHYSIVPPAGFALTKKEEPSKSDDRVHATMWVDHQGAFFGVTESPAGGHSAEEMRAAMSDLLAHKYSGQYRVISQWSSTLTDDPAAVLECSLPNEDGIACHDIMFLTHDRASDYTVWIGVPTSQFETKGAAMTAAAKSIWFKSNDE